MFYIGIDGVALFAYPWQRRPCWRGWWSGWWTGAPGPSPSPPQSRAPALINYTLTLSIYWARHIYLKHITKPYSYQGMHNVCHEHILSICVCFSPSQRIVHFMDGLEEVSLSGQVQVVFRSLLKRTVYLTEIKYYSLADIELSLTLIQIADDIRRVVSQELTRSLQVLRFGLRMLSL